MPALERGARAGFSLIELVISLTVFGLLIGAALGFMSAENRAFQGGLDRMTGLQTARFALQVLEEDIATAGTNVPSGQPSLVLAGTDVIGFTADYVTRVANDPFAAYYDPDAPAGTVSVPASATVLPNSSFQFPDTAYLSGGALSPAELIVFYFTPDTATARSDDYALFRKVNAAAPELVAANLLAPASAPFFRYFRGTATSVDSVSPAALPLAHSVKIHLSAGDTGAVARVDSIRAVRVTVRATNGEAGEHEQIEELTRILRMPNLGLGMLQACGSPPILGQPLSAVVTATPTGEPAVRLDWNRATDESSGEGDVMRYVIWRRDPGAGFADPYLSIPAGQPTYTYLDTSIEAGASYVYGLAAQDCTPSLSPITSSAQVTIP
jgi:prepilin-type N-terminal cleavage/methylation domain-containing protein